MSLKQADRNALALKVESEEAALSVRIIDGDADESAIVLAAQVG